MIADMSEKKRKQTSMLFRLLIATGFSIFAINFIQVLIVRNHISKSIQSDNIETYQIIAEGYAKTIENKMQGYLSALDYYVNSDIVKTGDVEQIRAWLIQHTSSRNKEFDYILVAGADGIGYTDLGGVTEISDRSYFKDILYNGKDFSIDNPVIARTTGLPVVHVTRALKSNGRTFGLICGILNVGKITDEVNSIKIGSGGYAWMLASDGLVISHPNKDYVMVKNFITGLDKGFEDMADVARNVSNGQNGWGWVSGLNGGKDLIAYHGIANTPWGFALSIPNEMIFGLIKEYTLFSVGFGVFTVIVLLVILGILIYATIKPLKIVVDAITGIASGHADLTKRIEVHSDNEIGSVVNGFNLFVQKLQSIIGDVKSSKEELSTAGLAMENSTRETASSLNEILGIISDIREQISSQGQSVNQTAGAMTEITANIQSLDRMIEGQASGVTQASSAVEQMIGNIASVNQSVDKMADSFTSLRTDSQTGFAKQKIVNERISQIETQSQMLQSANAAISSIASQTNLLAMNAAIEAAHAGEAGKGFAVVADEIRKLSENSTAQSKTIGHQLNGIKDSINGVVAAANETSIAFESVSQKLEETDELVLQIKAAMEEQNSGSKQITAALHAMNDSTLEVKNAASEMQEGGRMVQNEMLHLQDSANVVNKSMETMSTTVQHIEQVGSDLSDIASKVKDSIVKIGEQIDQFKV